MKCKYHLCKSQVPKSTTSKVKKFCSDKCQSKYHVDRRRWTLKFKAVQHKGGRCSKCGYNKCIAALDFHHRNPAEKSFAISLPHTRSWDKLLNEVNKCDLLCANCHREVEFELRTKDKLFIKEFSKLYGFEADI